MPKLDGIDTCGVIRAKPWAGEVQLVAVTGHDPDEFRERLARPGSGREEKKGVPLRILCKPSSGGPISIFPSQIFTSRMVRS